MATSKEKLLALLLGISGLWAVFVGGLSYLEKGDPRTTYLIVGIVVAINAIQMICGASRFEQRLTAKTGFTIWVVFSLVDLMRYLTGDTKALPPNWALQVVGGVGLAAVTCWYWLMDKKKSSGVTAISELKSQNPADRADV